MIHLPFRRHQRTAPEKGNETDFKVTLEAVQGDLAWNRSRHWEKGHVSLGEEKSCQQQQQNPGKVGSD